VQFEIAGNRFQEVTIYRHRLSLGITRYQRLAQKERYGNRILLAAGHLTQQFNRVFWLIPGKENIGAKLIQARPIGGCDFKIGEKRLRCVQVVQCNFNKDFSGARLAVIGIKGEGLLQRRPRRLELPGIH
jgi:hypothetical protein